MPLTRVTVADLHAFIFFADKLGDKTHELDLAAPQRRRAERLIKHGVLSKSRSTDPDREPGDTYFFDRLLAERDKLDKVESMIRKRGLIYHAAGAFLRKVT